MAGRGFAGMPKEQLSEIARKGGKAAHAHGTAHEFTSEEAKAAGRKGGRAQHAKKREAAATAAAVAVEAPTEPTPPAPEPKPEPAADPVQATYDEAMARS
jgi:uncharacterized protein